MKEYKDKNKNAEENKEKDNNVKLVKELGTNVEVDPGKEIYFLNIIGEIEGHITLPAQNKTTKYEHVIPQIVGAEMDNEIKGIMIILNTLGGDVEAGLAISELIASLTKPTVALILGGGHSIGNALAASTTYSMIAPTATMTIHPIRTSGLVIGVPQTFRYFQKMQERITDFIVNNSKVKREKLLEYMYNTDQIANDVGTILSSEEAVNLGLIDQIGGFKEAVIKIKELIGYDN